MRLLSIADVQRRLGWAVMQLKQNPGGTSFKPGKLVLRLGVRSRLLHERDGEYRRRYANS